MHYIVTITPGCPFPFTAYDKYSAEFLAKASTLDELKDKMTFLSYREAP